MRRPHPGPSAASAGFGLVELVVAMTLLSFALLGLAGASVVALREMNRADELAAAVHAAAAVLDSVMRAPVPAGGSGGGDGLQWEVAMDSALVHGVVTTTGPAGRQRTWMAVRLRPASP